MCTACRAELEQMESALMQFRSAMRDPANSVPAPIWQEPTPTAPWYSWPRLVLVAAAMMILVAVPVSWRARERQQAAQAARAAIADSQLLESVDSAISKAIPEPMEPLVSLVSWNSATQEQNQKAQRQ